MFEQDSLKNSILIYIEINSNVTFVELDFKINRFSLIFGLVSLLLPLKRSKAPNTYSLKVFLHTC